MPARKAEATTPKRKRPPATTPEGRENQMIALAIDCAEEQMRNGTASSQVIVHYLKLGAIRHRLENDILVEQNKLVKAKTDSIQSAKRVEELYTQALEAMQVYSGNARKEEYDDY